jgi:glycosyltransferase involved in cell wall biosynthesis
MCQWKPLGGKIWRRYQQLDETVSTIEGLQKRILEMTYNTPLTVSVIIPVHNAGPYFHSCLSKLAATKPRPLEIIVVADGDSDGSWRLANDYGAKVIRIPECGGPARARNLGARVAQGDILFFTDADVAIYPDTISSIAGVFEKEPHLAALIGSYDDTPGASNFLSQYRNLLHHYVHQHSSEEASTFWGACGAVRRDIFLAMGGFNEGYKGAMIEDIELGYRLKETGYRIRLCKNIQVKHLKIWKPVSMIKADFFYRALPWTELLLRDRHRFNNDLNIQLNSRLSVLSVYTLILSLIASFWWIGCLGITLLCCLLLLALNFPVYKFFYEKRGLIFTLKALPWHWLYYMYSGLGFVVALIRYYSLNHWLPKVSSFVSVQ